jgi:hypothetical protein
LSVRRAVDIVSSEDPGHYQCDGDLTYGDAA